MNEFVNVNYSELAKKVKEAKHKRAINSLTGMSRTIIYYMYSEILDGIENGFFSKRISFNARSKLFFINFDYNSIYVHTKHKYAQRIKGFKMSTIEQKEMIKTIESAMQLVGLETEMKMSNAERKMEVFMSARKMES